MAFLHQKSKMVARQIQVFGKVQGVWYRKSTQIKAQALGLNGTVQNLDDGTVLIYVEGIEPQVNALIEWSKTGSDHAIVEKIESSHCAIKGLQSFDIIRK